MKQVQNESESLPAPPARSLPPVAHASGSHTLTLPNNSLVLRGSVTNGDQTQVRYLWVRDRQSPAAGVRTEAQRGEMRISVEEIPLNAAPNTENNNDNKRPVVLPRLHTAVGQQEQPSLPPASVNHLAEAPPPALTDS